VEAIFYRITNNFGIDLVVKIIYGYKLVFTAIALGYIVHWIPETIKEKYRTLFASQSFMVMGLLAMVAIFFMYQLMSGEMQPFIYFQF
jgi:hypothetical protein